MELIGSETINKVPQKITFIYKNLSKNKIGDIIFFCFCLMYKNQIARQHVCTLENPQILEKLEVSKCAPKPKYLKKKNIANYHVSCVTCHLSPVTCHLTTTLTVKSLAPICSTSTCTVFSELCRREIHTVRQRPIKRKYCSVGCQSMHWLFTEVEDITALPCSTMKTGVSGG